MSATKSTEQNIETTRVWRGEYVFYGVETTDEHVEALMRGLQAGGADVLGWAPGEPEDESTRSIEFFTRKPAGAALAQADEALEATGLDPRQFSSVDEIDWDDLTDEEKAEFEE